jgi:hypothetical protein
MKVVISRCYGGFSLSDKAFVKLLERKGVAFDKVDGESSLLGASYYKAGHAGDDDHYISEYHYYEDRSDPDLIAVVEEMGKEANGWAAELAVLEIPDDVEYEVEEYDGAEWVAEIHRTWR